MPDDKYKNFSKQIVKEDTIVEYLQQSKEPTCIWDYTLQDRVWVNSKSSVSSTSHSFESRITKIIGPDHQSIKSDIAEKENKYISSRRPTW